MRTNLNENCDGDAVNIKISSTHAAIPLKDALIALESALYEKIYKYSHILINRKKLMLFLSLLNKHFRLLNILENLL